VWLNGQLSWGLAAHELGHTLGLGHADRWACLGSSCSIEEYGNMFSVMGYGAGDFNAYEKWRLGWPSNIVRPRGGAKHELGSIEWSTTLPKALVVTTAKGEFWFESHGEPTPSFRDESVQPPSVAVIATPGPGGETSYPGEHLLLANPKGGARYGYSTAEPGSGVEAYTLFVDGRRVRRLSEIPDVHWEATLRLSRGWHRVGVFATDRAGNRGPAAFARVRVK
jgi:Gametolysin peptidase M11